MASRNLGIVAAAMYDAINSVNVASSFFQVRVDAPGNASAEAATVAAAAPLSTTTTSVFEPALTGDAAYLYLY
jgi:hypothetical protein